MCITQLATFIAEILFDTFITNINTRIIVNIVILILE